MRRTIGPILVLALGAQAPVPAAVGAEGATAAAPAGIRGVTAPGAALERVADGFNGTEGVVGMPDGSVLFCEQNADRIVHLALDGRADLYLQGANRAIGLAIDRRGRLVAAQSREPLVGTLMPQREALVDAYGGQPLVKPNDLVIGRNGAIYFTDPLPKVGYAFRDSPPGRKAMLIHRAPTGRLVGLAEGITEPNGIQLSPDEKILYLANGSHIDAFDVAADGSLTRRRVFADVAGDGLAVDADGRLYAATRAGVEVIDRKGGRLGLIAAPFRVQSIAFAGRDRRFLYAVGGGKVYRIRTVVPGVHGRWK